MATTTESLLTGLATLCDQKKSSSITKAPFVVELAGRTWTGATNGHALMLVDAESTAPSPHVTGPQAAKLDELLGALIGNWPATGRVTRAALRTWVGGVDDPKACPDCHGAPVSKPVECEECYGTGKQHHRCEDCEHDCPDCDGDGTVEQEACDHGLSAPSYGAVTDGAHTLTIDRAVLAPLLALMTGDTIDVALAGPDDRLSFRGDGWRAALMPVRSRAVVAMGPTLTLEGPQ